VTELLLADFCDLQRWKPAGTVHAVWRLELGFKSRNAMADHGQIPDLAMIVKVEKICFH